MKLIKWFFDSVVPEWWNIGFIFNFDIEVFLEQKKLDIRWLKHTYKDRWFADPFILDVSEHTISVLVEEFYAPRQKGRIAKLLIDKHSLELQSIETVLELETHLSFPAIYKQGDDIYMYPENCLDGSLILYNYNPHKSTVEPVMPLVNEPLTDAVIVNYNGTFYIFSTKLPEQNSNKLYVYKSDSLRGNYVLAGCYTFPDCSARGAGDIIKNGGRLFRPAQDCNTEYGKGLVLQEVKYENGIFLFEELGRVYPSSKKWNAGLHTLNIYEHIAVIDGKRYKNALMRKMFLCANRLRKTVLKKIYGG